MEIEKTICQRIASVAQFTLAEWGSAFSDVTINGVNGVNVTISVPGFATVLNIGNISHVASLSALNYLRYPTKNIRLKVFK